MQINDERRLATLNLALGVQVYGEKLITLEGREYRVWDAFRSKLAAAIRKGLKQVPLTHGSKVLYLGVSTGTTASHISDIIGQEGVLFAVEFAQRVAKEFIDRVARHRQNIIPIIEDARSPQKYRVVFDKVDIVYCDIAQPDQTDIAITNCAYYLKPHGFLLLVIKARSIDVVEDPKKTFEEEISKLRNSGFRILEAIRLDPYDKDHAMILAQKMPSNL